MTTPDATAETPPPDPAQDYLPPVVRPDADTRLDQLVAEYHSLKPLADEYAERLETIKTGIKAELRGLHPDRTEILLIGSTTGDPLRLEAVTKWGLDTRKLKETEPETYARFARQSTSWYLRQVKG